MNDLLAATLTSGSQQVYTRAWDVFHRFFNLFYRPNELVLPVKSPTLAIFISYLSAKKLSASTIVSYLSAIGYVHKIRDLPDPTKSFLIHKLLTAVKRQRSPDVRLPITKPVLSRLVASLIYTNASETQRVLYKAMFMLAFFGFFRIGELATKGPETHCKVVQIGDLAFLKSGSVINKISITICEFKHNTQRRPFEILIERAASASFCPVRALLDYCSIRGSQPGPLFSLHGNPVSVYVFNTQFISK